MLPYNERLKLHRPCKKCDERFLPTGKYIRVCDDCRVKERRTRKIHEKETLIIETYRQKLNKLKKLKEQNG